MSDINVSSAINTFASYQSTAINTNRTTAKTTAAASKGAADTVDISQKNEEKLSSKAKEYLKSLREKYGDYDFLVGNSTDDLKTLSKSGSKEFSVIFSNAEIEKMATDEKYAAEKMQGVEGAVKMCRRICEENGYVSAFDAMKAGNGTVNKIGIVTDDNGNMKFFAELEGVTDPERKRKIIGKGFIDVFDAEAQKITDAKWLAQGTIYPDRIESLNITGKVIKSHHNVGGLPEKMNLKLCEPLQWLFKDEVRRVGRELGMPEHLIERHPFPGPGLAVRILGDITPEKVRVLQDADDIFIRGLRNWKVTEPDGTQTTLYNKVWQAGVVLLPVKSVGVMGDERTYERAVALRSVTSTDAMTADWAHLPYEFLAKVSNDIINHVKGVNRVCYDISSKPPSTIEWE